MISDCSSCSSSHTSIVSALPTVSNSQLSWPSMIGSTTLHADAHLVLNCECNLPSNVACSAAYTCRPLASVVSRVALRPLAGAVSEAVQRLRRPSWSFHQSTLFSQNAKVHCISSSSLVISPYQCSPQELVFAHSTPSAMGCLSVNIFIQEYMCPPFSVNRSSMP